LLGLVRAGIRYDPGPNNSSRKNVQRKIVVMANVAERDLNSVVNDIRKRIDSEIALPRGCHVEFGGRFESAESATRTLLVPGPVVIVGIFLLLFIAFHSARDALLIMLNLPLALNMVVVPALYLRFGSVTREFRNSGSVAVPE
jgi:Cu/Ag efflux pump CusA